MAQNTKISALVLIALLCWSLFFAFTANFGPSQIYLIFIFFGILFFAFGFTLSAIALMLLLVWRDPSELRMLVSFKIGFFISFMAVGLVFLKVFDILNVFNGGLFFVLCVALASYFKSGTQVVRRRRV